MVTLSVHVFHHLSHELVCIKETKSFVLSNNACVAFLCIISWVFPVPVGMKLTIIHNENERLQKYAGTTAALPPLLLHV